MRLTLHSSLLILGTVALYVPTDSADEEVKKCYATFRIFLLAFNFGGLMPLVLFILYILNFH